MSEGAWSRWDVGGHACDAYEPPRPSPNGYTVIYLHGVHLNRIAEQPAFMREFDRHGLRVLCPWTARSWWTDKICAEFDPTISAERFVIKHVLPALEERWHVRPPALALLGTSMGGQGALRLAYRFPNQFPTAAAIAPAIDFQHRLAAGDEALGQMYPNAEAARQDTATLHIHPLNWPRNQWFCCDPEDVPWHESAERLRMKLSALGVPYQCDLETTGGGHSFEYYSRMATAALGFIAEKLENERRRV